MNKSDDNYISKEIYKKVLLNISHCAAALEALEHKNGPLSNDTDKARIYALNAKNILNVELLGLTELFRDK